MKSSYKYILLLLMFLTGSLGMKNHCENKIENLDPAIKKSLLLTPEVIKHYSDKLLEILKIHDFKGNIILALNGKIVFEQCFGYADISQKKMNDTKTSFQLASVSKQFTAMGIAILKEKGKLKYDDLVKKYIPEFPYDNITIRNLLSHTSGLTNYVWQIENNWKESRMPDNEDLIKLYTKHTLPLNFRPGARFKYCNTGYAFLASVIERVSGKSYATFLKENIFDVLCMDNTYVFQKDVFDTLPDLALSYVKRRGKLTHYENDNSDGIVGDKGIYSSVEDLLKWDAALYGDILLPQKSINELFRKNVTNKGDSILYGMGWRLPKTSYPQMVYHNGWWHGNKATIRRYISDKNTLIVLNNTNQKIAPVINEIQHFLYPDIQTETSDSIE